MTRRILASLTVGILLTARLGAQNVMPAPKFTALADDGTPCASCKLYAYVAGTTTPQDTFSDSGLTSANTNPVILDAAGRATVFLSAASYKFVLTNSTGGTIYWTQDNISASAAFSVATDITGTAGQTITAGQGVYLSDGSGALTAGRWYPTSSTNTYSSSLPSIVGVAPSAIASGSTGAIRLKGRIAGLAGLTAGTIYYVAATAGTFTATAPANIRFIGTADTTTTLVVAAAPPQPPVDTSLSCGRLTLTTAVPVTIANVTAATTLFYTPIGGCNQVTVWNGSQTVTDTLTEISIAVPATTSQMYDVWVYESTPGTLALELTAWTNDSTRATAISIQNGFYAKTGTATRKYVGSFRTTAVSGQTEDSFSKRFVWNYYNRLKRQLRVVDSTDSWTYSGNNVYQQANASTANQIEVVIGVAEVPIVAAVVGYGNSNNATLLALRVSIGEDSTTTPATGVVGQSAFVATASLTVVPRAELQKYPAVGYHKYVWLETPSSNANTTTWFGDNGDPTDRQSGIWGVIEGR